MFRYQSVCLRWMVFGLFSMLVACQSNMDPEQAADWQHYKARFITDDGRVVDTGNGNISHSEGQGFGMLLAVWQLDRDTFDTVWRWTQQQLQVRSDKLFIWRKRPGVPLQDEDKNNASDGDVLISWALLEAARQWQNPEYAAAAQFIMQDIKQKLLYQWQGQLLLLPGESGFKTESAVTINLSYWIFPALQAYQRADPDPIWHQLADSGLALLDKARFGRWQLPPDWLVMDQQAWQPGKQQRFGYDAVRIPLYLIMGNIEPHYRKAFADSWMFYRGYTPAWQSLTDNVMDAYGASEGIQAIRLLTLLADQRLEQEDFARVTDQEDYYSATLLLLSKKAYQKSLR